MRQIPAAPRDALKPPCRWATPARIGGGIEYEGIGERNALQARWSERRSMQRVRDVGAAALGECTGEYGSAGAGVDTFDDITHIEDNGSTDCIAAGAGIGDEKAYMARECALRFECVDNQMFEVRQRAA